MTDVLTYHNDNARTGQTVHEEILTSANVTANHFGKLWVLPTDGKVDAQPLYAAGVSIPGKRVRNVLFVVTEHDSVYAFDADSTTIFWQVSMLGAGETPSDDRGCRYVTPEIGITATPVIDRQLGANGTMFLVAMSKDGAGNYYHRVHALDLSTGSDRVAPVVVTASYPGSGDNTQNGSVVFDPGHYKERVGLLLLGGVIYTAWSSHCGDRPYTGWIMGYDEHTLAQTTVLNITPNDNGGAIWMSGAGLAADVDNYIYFLAGNGTFDTTLTSTGFPEQGDYGNAFLKLSTAGGTLTVADYFASYQTPIQNTLDQELGAGGALVLPDMVDSQGHTNRLAVGAGKDENLYLVDRSNMGKFNATNDNAIYQKLNGALPGGIWSMPAYFNGTLYYGPVGQSIRAFPFQQARLGSFSSRTPGSFAYPGATPSVSANGPNGGIVWATENTSPAVLHAYAATNLAVELYNSDQAPGGRDQFGTGNKFITPTIASARVYVGTTTGVGVFGLLDSTTLTPLQAWRNSRFGNPSNVGAAADSANPAGDGLANLMKYALGLDAFTKANPDLWPITSLQPTNGQHFLSLTVNRATRVPDIAYNVEVSGDAKTWASGSPNTVTLADTDSQLVVRDNTPVGAAPRFIRLAVTSSLSNSGVATSSSVTNAGLVTIPDIGTATPYPSDIYVSGMTGVVTNVTVSLNELSHTYVHDVNVLLTAPGGQNALLMSHVGGTLGVTNVSLTFDDAASAGLPLDSQVVTGTYKPTADAGGVTFPTPAPAPPYGASLSALNGSAPNGVWSLYILDDSANDHGMVAGGWSVTITTQSNTAPPSISSQPTNQPLVLGGTATFAVVATGTAPLSYRWFKDGLGLVDNGRIVGSRNSVLTISSLQSSDVGDYQVVVSNTLGSVTSAVASLSPGSPPANDNFAAAQAISGNSGSVSSNNFNATKEAGEPNHAGNPGGASVWYAWTAPSTSPVTFDTALSGFDTLLAVYTGSSVSALTPIASNNDMNANSTRSRVTFTPAAGTVYMIAVDGNNGVMGNFTLRWAQATTPLPDLSIVASAVSAQITTETFASSSCAVMEGLIPAGTRTLIRFNTQTENSGTADLYFGDPANNPLFVWAPCHAHYHFNNYMSYRLRDANGNIAAIGLKVGFCILDVFRWSPSAPADAHYTCSNQGIQPGWGDLYDSTVDGQWIDITGLPAGNYTMELEANPQGIIQEANYDNNIATVPIALGDPTAPPPNDNFVNAQTLLGGFTSVTGNNQNATKEPGEPDHAGNPGGHSIWYQWTAVSTLPVTIDTIGSSFNTLLAVYTGSNLTNLSLVASNDDIGYPTNLQSQVTFNATAGVMYDIAVDGFNGATGSVVLTVDQTIQNDNFAFCTFVGGVGGAIRGSNVGATKEPGEPDHAGNSGGASIWYCWTAPINGVATFNTIGSTFNTLLAVYTGGSVSNLTLIASNDDIGPPTNLQSQVVFDAAGLTSYHIAIDGFNGATGDTVLNWSLAARTPAVVATLPHQLVPVSPAQSGQAGLSHRLLPEGEFQLAIAGGPSQRYLIEVSADLVHWRPLVATLSDPFGQAFFTDKSTHSKSRSAVSDPVCGPGQVAGGATGPRTARFYRAVPVATN